MKTQRRDTIASFPHGLVIREGLGMDPYRPHCGSFNRSVRFTLSDCVYGRRVPGSVS